MTTPARRVLASPPLGDRGGGIGQVSAMLWAVMRKAWPESAELLTMDLGDRAIGRLASKLRFGAAIGARQASGSAHWVLFAHLGLARAQRAIPARFRGPYGVFLHGIEGWATLDAADVAMLNGASLRVANSAYTAARVRAANPTMGPIAVCPLALPLGLGLGSHLELPYGNSRCDPNPNPNPNGSASRRKASGQATALMVGRMAAAERYKGHDELIDVWPRVVDAIPDARLVIVGDGDDRERLSQKASRSRVSGSIQFAGFVDAAALERIYETSTVFAMPSRGEGFGLVYLEAMAHALPCIGSIHDAAREVIVDGETGLLVDPGDGDALAGALVTLLGDRAVAAAYGSAGYARLQAQFGLARFERQILAHLHRAFESADECAPALHGGAAS